jgi:protein phosphatase
MKVRAYALSHIGMVREENQDAFLSDEQNGLFIVADGMGGLENGALAANM